MKNQHFGLLLFRLSVGVLLIFHGIHKIFNGVDSIIDMLSDKGIPGFLGYAVYIGEVIAPLLLIIGYRTRLAALLIVANFMVIIFVAHPGEISSFTGSGAWALEVQGLYLFASLALFFTGGGKYGLSVRNRWD